MVSQTNKIEGESSKISALRKRSIGKGIEIMLEGITKPPSFMWSLSRMPIFEHH